MPIVNSKVHKTVKIWHPELVNIYDSKIGQNTKIASFVEVGGSQIGCNCKIEAFAFIPPGTVIGDFVFIGPHVAFCNDKYPKCAMALDWKCQPATVENYATIGAGSVILPGVRIGKYATVGAGSVVVKDVPQGAMVHGEKARLARSYNDEGGR